MLSFFLADCEPHWGNWTLSHHKHNFWLWPLLSGQNHSSEAAKLPGHFWIVLKTCAAGCNEEENHTSLLPSFCCSPILKLVRQWKRSTFIPELLSFLERPQKCTLLHESGDSYAPPGLHLKSLDNPTLPKKKHLCILYECLISSLWRMHVSTLPYHIVYLLSMSFKCVCV